MKNLSLILLLIFSLSIGYCQRIPTLKVNDKEIGLYSLDINVEVVGNIATTTYDMLYFNPTNEILEGELSFPLGKGHNVSRFALDINGKLREAVVVDKELGRIAFEQVVREGVDPALLEKGTGNNYKARIYPIPANGYKRLVLSYEQELIYNDNSHFYNLPLNFKNKLKSFELEIQVFDQKDKPIITEGSINGLEFFNWEKNYRTSVTKKDFTPNKSLLIKIPVPLTTQKTIIHDNFFYAYKTLSPKKRLRKKPKTINLFWDTSLSMIERDFEKEKDFLNDYIKYLNNVTINLITFSNTIISQEKYIIKDGKTDKLIYSLKHLVYDGGTDYTQLINFTKKADAILLFSDGIATLSELNLTKQTPIFIVNSITKTNHVQLDNISNLTNGAYLDLNNISKSEALNLMKNKPYKFLSYTCHSKNIEVYPKPGVSVKSDFSIAGKDFKKEKIQLHFGYGNEVTETIIIDLTDNNITNKKVKRIWANKKLSNLEIDAKENKQDIKRLGLDYQLVTDYTSLIVLDDVMDYIRYKITPPEELLDEYNKVLAEIKKEEDKKETVSLGLLNGFTNDDVDEERPLRTNVAMNRQFEGVQTLDISDNFNEEYVINHGINQIESSTDVIIEENNSPLSYYSSPTNDSIRISKYTGSLKVKDRKLKTDYLEALRKTNNAEEAYLLYLNQRNKHLKTPAYYVDVSNHFANTYNNKAYSNIILSNISETDFDNYELLKVFAYQLQYNNEHEKAIFIFKRILELRPEDSQSYRDLALAYQNVGKCQKALDLFNAILTGEIYHNKNRRVFEGIELIAKNEIKNLIQKYKYDLDLSEIDKDLIDEMYFDIRIVVDWNHNDTDIDLHVIDPNLEECFYSHSKTKIGGNLSPDMTQGFGPEEYTLKKAKKGDYFVKIKYYGDRYQKIENPTFMKVTIYKNYGAKNESKSVELIRLTKKDDEEIIAKLTF